jgi:hypothetical protein
MGAEAIRDRWVSSGVVVRPGLPTEQISAFEHRYGVLLPEELRQFYGLMDGMGDGETDEELISFWPLSEVGSVPEKLSDFRGIPDYGGIEASLPDASSYFVFADHSIWVHVYAVRLGPDPAGSGPVVWIGGKDCWEQITASFAEFLRRYEESPRCVLFPGPDA